MCTFWLIYFEISTEHTKYWNTISPAEEIPSRFLKFLNNLKSKTARYGIMRYAIEITGHIS